MTSLVREFLCICPAFFLILLISFLATSLYDAEDDIQA